MPSAPFSYLKRLARVSPYVRRVQDGLGAMREHIANLEQEVDRLRLAQAKPAADRAVAGAAGRPRPVYFIDQVWRDTGGVLLEGWVHAGAQPVRRLALEAGRYRVETAAFTPRRDVAQHYAGLPDGAAAGFSLYLACSADLPLLLGVATDDGVDEVAVALTITTDAPEDDALGACGRFVASMTECRGTVLELGARLVGSLTQDWRGRFEPACRYLGNDIHPGHGIDVVGDVHSLTNHVPRGSLDGLFSVAVLEHLVAPWLAAMEINRSLRVGGQTLHVTHQSWPIHETPNDYFRMSDQALRSLFGPAHGFEVLECRMAHPVRIMPPTYMRHSSWLQVPVGRGYAQSYIHARKVAEIDDAASPWSTDTLARMSEAYPKPVPSGSAGAS